MPKQALSDASVKSLPPPSTGQITVWDASFKQGLFGCRVSQGGAKTFIIKHRNRRITLGRYPTITLAEARTEAKRLLAEFTLGRVRPQSITYTNAVTLFLEEKTKGRRASTVESYRGLLTRLSFACKVSEITPEDVRRKLSKRPNYNHHLVALKVFFNWCIKRRFITDNPTLGLSQHKKHARNRVLTDVELAKIWKATEEPTTFNKIVRLLILTGMRRNEAASLKVAYYSHNQQTICLPPEATKNSRPLMMPTPQLATSLLASHLKTLSEPTSESLLFAARGNSKRPFSGWSKSKKALDKASGVTGYTLHDLRRTFRTIHGKIKTPPHIAERLVNHLSAQTDMEKVYDVYPYLDEMRAAMHNYEEYLITVFSSEHT